MGWILNNAHRLNRAVLLCLCFSIISCLPKVKKTSCDSDEAYDSKKRKCVPTLASDGIFVTISNKSPDVSSSFSNNDNNTYTYQVTINDPYGAGYSLQWYLIGNGASTLVGQNTTSYSLNPSSIGDGSFVLELVLKSEDGSETYSSTTWNITIGSQAIPYFDSSTNNYVAVARSNTAVLFQVNVYDPSNFGNLALKMFVDGVQQGTTQTSSGSPFLFAETIDASNYSVGSHTVRAFVYNSSETTLYGSFTWIMDVSAPIFSDVVANDPPVTCGTTLVENTALNSGTSPAINNCDDSTTTYCVTVDDQDDTSMHPSGVQVEFFWDTYATASRIGSATTLTSDTICLIDVQATFQKSLGSGNTEETHAILTKFTDISTGLEMYQSNDERVEWSVQLVEQNRAPQLTIAASNTHCINDGTAIDEDSTTAVDECGLTQNTAQAFEINILWDEYTDPENADITNYDINFYLDGVLLDGNNEYSTTDCAHSPATATANLTCNLVLKPFDDSGPVDPSSLIHTLTAVIVDNGSPYGGGSKSSNTLTWTIGDSDNDGNGEIVESQAGISVTAFAFDTNTYNENDTATITITTDDSDGDNFKYDIYYLFLSGGGYVAGQACSTGTIIASLTNSNQTRNSLPTNVTSQTVTINWLIPQDIVTTAAASGDDHYFCISATDISDTQTATTATADTGAITITQYNPDPVADTNEQPARGDAQVVVAGIPFSFDAPDITDTSTTDGDVLSYQWQIDDGSNTVWTDIDGATSTSLVWTPGAGQNFGNTMGATTTYQIRLCIGDDGYDNPVSSCGTNVTWTDITPISNVLDFTGSDGTFTFGPDQDFTDVATAYDSTNNVSYTVYNSDDTLPDKYLIVEKVYYNADGRIYYNETIDSISLQTDNLSTTATVASDISVAVDPTNEFLFISYIADDDTLVTYPRPHVVRINLENDNRVAGTLDDAGSFGFSYDGPEITSSDNADITININTSDQTEIIINAVERGDQVLFNHKNLVTAELGADFCDQCQTGSSVFNAATELATFINQYNTTTDLQGLSASVVGNRVVIKELMSNDYLDFPVAANGMGEIMLDISANRFYVPVINNSLAGTNKNKITMFYGDYDGTALGDITLNQVNIDGTGAIDSDPSSEITSVLDEANDRIYMATKAADDGHIDLYSYDTTSNTFEDDVLDTGGGTGIWEGTLVEDIKIKYDDLSGDRNIFLLARVVSDSALAAYKVPYSGAAFDTANEVNSSDVHAELTAGYQIPALDSDIHAFDFAPMESNDDVVLVLNSHETASGLVNGNNIYVIKLSMDSATTMKADCSFDQDPEQMNCIPLNNNVTYNYVDNTAVSISKVHLNETLGSDGARGGDNEKNIAVINYMVNDGANVVQNVILNAEEDYFTPTGLNLDSFAPAFLPP